jgi:hypothetical protein
MLRWEFQHSLTQQPGGKFATDFYVRGGKDWNNEKLHSLFFCVPVFAPSLKTPPSNSHTDEESNHLWPKRPSTFPLCFLGFGCLIVKSETNCILNQMIAEIFTFLPSRNFTVPSMIELISTMFDAVFSWSPSNVAAIYNPHKYRSGFWLFVFAFLCCRTRPTPNEFRGENQFTLLIALDGSQFQHFVLIHSDASLICSCRRFHHTPPQETPLNHHSLSPTTEKLQISSSKTLRHTKS